ncbi:9485_t:CDS:10, partial [Paraglomus occultum]
IHAEFYTALWNNSRYIVFGTADKVVIYDGHFKHIQTICVREFLVDLVTSPECKVISVELSNTHGQLAVTIESYVLVFCPNKQSGQDETQWILNAILRHDSPVCSTSWSLNYDKHELWVGGGKISLWKCDIDGNTTSSWTKEYERSVASNVTLIKVSPDSSLVATVGKYDRMVKIWWQSLNNARAYEFEYLSHPGAVTSLNWRLGTDEMRTPGQNTLFTMCRDGICRIWSSTNPEEPCVLYVAAVIDPNNEVLATPIHWIHAAEFVSAVRLALDALEGEGQNGVGNLVRRLTSLANNTPDLMYQVQKDGSMIIWAIQNLNARPRRIVRVLVLLRMAQALFPLDAVYFSGSVSVYHDHSGLKTKSTIFPADLTLIAQSPHGRINCYTINLTDFFDSTRPTTRLYLKHSMTGHHSDVVDIIKAPGTDNLASIAKDGEVIVWDTETPRFGARVSQGMVERSPVWLDSKIKLACLLPG